MSEPVPPGLQEPASQLLREAGSQSAPRELAAMVLRLGRIRRGELPAPASWTEATFVRDVVVVVRQLSPLYSRASLQASFEREAVRSEVVLVAYAVAWRDLRRSHAAASLRQGRRCRWLRAIKGTC